MSQETNTLGWDTVSSIPVKYVNQAIVTQNSSPANMEYNSLDGLKLSCLFDHWQISSGGNASGQEVKFMLPCKNMQVSTKSSLFGENTATWEDVKIYIYLYLQWVPAPAVDQTKTTVKTHHLVPRLSALEKDLPIASYITYESQSTPAGTLVTSFDNEQVFSNLIGGMLCNWVSENLDKFAHIFAFVDLNEELDKNLAWAWCKPSDVGYAYISGNSPGSSLLGVLCMTGGRTAGAGQAYEVDQNIIPAGAIGGYLVSDKRFLMDMVLPILPKKFTRAKTSYWSVTNPSTKDGKYTYTLTLQQSFQLDDIVHDGNTYSPEMTTFDVQMVGGYVEITTETSTEINQWVTSYCNTTHKYKITLDSSDQILSWTSLGDPVVIHHIVDNTPEGYKIAMDIIGAVLAVVITVCTEGAGIVLGAIVAGMFTGLANIDEAIAASNTDTSPDPCTAFASNLHGAIRWPLGSTFHLDSATINGPLQLGFNPQFPTT
jgi:hypothetical protein